MALPAATAFAKSLVKKLFLHSPSKFSAFSVSFSTTPKATRNKFANKNKETRGRANEQKSKHKQKAELLVKRRTRSGRELNEEGFSRQFGNDNSAHIPVLLGEVLDVFSSVPLKSFVDCTLGAGGHSAAIIQAHPEMEFYVGLDVDPVAHEIAQARINMVLHEGSGDTTSNLQVHTTLKNFKNIKTVLHDIDEKYLASGINGVLMDLGMSSMQVNNAERGFSVLSDGPLDMRMNPKASLKAEDILNSWPEAEVGRILRDYGEESNWFSLQNKIVNARSTGGLHSTNELVDLIRNSTSWTRGGFPFPAFSLNFACCNKYICKIVYDITGGRQGWIKTATRVFQALRIAVNDELNTLKDSIHSCFDSLGSSGRLAIISFHSLEDRIVKQAFLNIVNSGKCGGGEENGCLNITKKKIDTCNTEEEEAWIKQIVQGEHAVILTKRPITPSELEERLNPRSRSAKLRVIQKI